MSRTGQPTRGVPAGALALAILASLGLGACRGYESDQPPVHMNPNLDSQPRYDPQSESKFFEDRRTMRQPVDGTVAKAPAKDPLAHYALRLNDAGLIEIDPGQKVTKDDKNFSVTVA